MKNKIILVIGISFILLSLSSVYAFDLFGFQVQYQNGTQSQNQHQNQTQNNTQGVVCTMEVKQCSDGSFVGRNPSMGCAYNNCPEDSIYQNQTQACPADSKQCPDGSWVSRSSKNNCEFDKCSSNQTETNPIACTMDVKMCSDGSYVGRDSSNGCKFNPCPGGEEKVCCKSYGYGSGMIKTGAKYEMINSQDCAIPEGFVGGNKEIVDNSYCHGIQIKPPFEVERTYEKFNYTNISEYA